MKVLECLKGIGGDLLLGEPGTEVDEVAYDSRKAARGCVFVFMKGTKVDSHDFVGILIFILLWWLYSIGTFEAITGVDNGVV